MIDRAVELPQPRLYGVKLGAEYFVLMSQGIPGWALFTPDQHRAFRWANPKAAHSFSRRWRGKARVVKFVQKPQRAKR